MTKSNRSAAFIPATSSGVFCRVSIKKSMSGSRYNISRHAKNEMSLKEDNISEKELIEAMLFGEIIENYMDDEPFQAASHSEELGKTDRYM